MNKIFDKSKCYRILAIYMNSYIILYIVNMVLGNGSIYSIIQYVLLFTFFLYTLAYIVFDGFKIPKQLFYILGIIILVTTFSALINGNVESFIKNFIPVILMRIIPGIYFIMNVSSFEKLKDILVKIQFIWVIFAVVGIIYIPQSTLNGYDMSFGYAFLLPMSISIYLICEEKKIIQIPFALFYLTMIVMYGSRGPLICFSVFLIIIYFYRGVKNKKNSVPSFILRLSVLVIICIFLIVNLGSFLTLLAKIMPNSRSIIMLQQLDFGDSGRSDIYDSLIRIINEEPFTFHGIFADRYYCAENVFHTNVSAGTHAHNIFLELLYQFGIPIAVAIIIIGCCCILRCFFLIKYMHKCEVYFFIMLFSSGFIKLLFSSSYLINTETYLFIGMVFYIINKYSTLYPLFGSKNVKRLKSNH